MRPRVMHVLCVIMCAIACRLFKCLHACLALCDVDDDAARLKYLQYIYVKLQYVCISTCVCVVLTGVSGARNSYSSAQVRIIDCICVCVCLCFELFCGFVLRVFCGLNAGFPIISFGNAKELYAI